MRDVIVFHPPDAPSEEVVHRIVRITKSKSGQLQFNTQGDANTVRDPWTLTIQGKYVYRVRWSLPLIGYAAVAYENHRGVALLAAGVILVAVAGTTLLESRRRRETPGGPNDVTS